MTVQYTNERIKAALAETKGLVYLAAKRVGCNPETIYARARVSQEIRDAIRHQRGEIVDHAELKLFQAILNGEAWAVAMTLKTLGKDRGYVERTETKQVTDADINAAIAAELARVAPGVPAADAGPPADDAGAREAG